MAARMTTCRDLIENEADFRKVGELFMTVQASATPASLVLPWFPNRARKTKKQATTELYTMVYTYVETRRHSELTNDAIDFLIAGGETTQKIVGASPAPNVVIGVVNPDPTFLVRLEYAFRWRCQHQFYL